MLTELEAINQILVASGEEPCNTITSPAALACKTIIRETIADTLSTGWSFNTDYDVVLNPDTSGQITIPVDAILVTFDDYQSVKKYTTRGRKLYNQFDRTYVFTSSLKASVIKLMDFTDIPEIFKIWITKTSKRKYFESFCSGQAIQSIAMEEADAMQKAKQSDVEQSQPNAFSNPNFIRFYQRGL